MTRLKPRTIRLIGRLHAWLWKLTGGKLGNAFGTAPFMMLATTGRKTGRERTTPVLYLQYGTDLIVAASFGGNDMHPAWYLNLECCPEAEVMVNGERRRLLNPEEARILSIRKGNLDPAERSEIESHVTHTFHFLQKIPWTKDLVSVPNIAYAHHEKLNGRGYPRKLTATEIPIQSRMMTISDIYDALDAAVVTERSVPGAPMVAFVDMLRDADRLSLEEITDQLHAIGTADVATNKQLREFTNVITRLPIRLAALVLRHVLRRSGADVVAEHRRGDTATLNLILGVGRRSV